MLFFFSSRRRHTRWPRDWSSDVCSSDLSSFVNLATGTPVHTETTLAISSSVTSESSCPCFSFHSFLVCSNSRSEERRVGKECRSRVELDEQRKKYASTRHHYKVVYTTYQ